jgi:putative cardiolipin synthase
MQGCRRHHGVSRRVAQSCAAVLVIGALLDGCATLPADYPRTESYALPDTADTRLGRIVAPAMQTNPGYSGVHLLSRGTDAFLARLVLAEVADRTLDVQYYIWHADTTGKVLTEAIFRAADRGVRVRIMLDDVGSTADDLDLLALDAHPNVEVRLFNPLLNRSARGLDLLTSFHRTNRRMHNKSFTADNQATIIGGRNVGDEYFEARADLEFGDLDLLTVGPAVGQVAASFDQFWNSTLAVPMRILTQERPTPTELVEARTALQDFVQSQRASPYAKALRDSHLSAKWQNGELRFHFGNVQVVYDDPSKVSSQSADPRTLLLPQLQATFEGIRSELLLVSPYFVPGEPGVDALRELRERGVRIRVLTNSLASTDVSIVHSGYARYRRALLDAGVELYEVKPTATRKRTKRTQKRERILGATHGVFGASRASLHAKTLIFDRDALFIGSMNLDPRSVLTNTEIGVVVESPALAQELLDTLDEDLHDSAYRVTLDATADGAGGPGLVWSGEDDGRSVRYTREPLASAWQRFKVWFYSLWPIEPLL